jgi:undecaprenyl diphosphate synthase
VLHSCARPRAERACRATKQTAGNTALHLCVALSYGGRQAVAAAARRLAAEAQAGRLNAADIDEGAFGAALAEAAGPTSPPDLLIRCAA